MGAWVRSAGRGGDIIVQPAYWAGSIGHGLVLQGGQQTFPGG